MSEFLRTLLHHKHIVALMMTLAVLSPALSGAAVCVASSEPHRVAVLELYTSEGCNSCPPADRWMNGLRGRGFTGRQVVPLAFHVDYWDYIGWKDRYARSEYAKRQRLIANRSSASLIYTPQFVLAGRDFRRPWLGDNLTRRLGEINAQTSDFQIKLTQVDNAGNLALSVDGHNGSAQSAYLYVVLYQNGLSSEVRAGENAGKKLYHEFVVRELEGPLLIPQGKSLTKTLHFEISKYADPTSLGVALFAEEPVSGATLQAMATPVCADRPDVDKRELKPAAAQRK